MVGRGNIGIVCVHYNSPTTIRLLFPYGHPFAWLLNFTSILTPKVATILGLVYLFWGASGVEMSTAFFQMPSFCLRQILTALLLIVNGLPVESVKEI